MKKLMIAASLVCAAAFAQAAAVSWDSGSSKLYADGKVATAITGGNIMLVVLDSTSTGWATGEWDGKVKTDLATAAVSTSSKSAGKVVGTQYKFDFGTQSFADGDTLAVVFKDSNGTYSQLQYVADDSFVTDSLKVAGLSDDGDLWSKTVTFASKGNFQVASVPEPTSAMLLLLGVAGLALKRRRA